MYIGHTAFVPATDRLSAKALFAFSVGRIEVEIHSYCNRRCDYCPNAVGDRLGSNQRMPDDIWSMILADLHEIDYAEYFVFSNYNEPLADRTVLQRIRQARQAIPRARIMVYSNGDYLNEAYLEELVAAGLDYLHISIHCKPGSSYREVDALNHIAKLERRIRSPIHFQQLKPGEFIFARVPHPKMEIEVRAINYHHHGTNRGGLVRRTTPVPKRSLPCYFPFTHFQVGYRGDVVPCCHLRSDADVHRQYRYGNLRDYGSIYETYASRIATEWRRHLISLEPKDPPCDYCIEAFLSNDQKMFDEVRRVWQRSVRDAPLP